jgi:tRNA(fMet)-specific endonuclease VapC
MLDANIVSNFMREPYGKAATIALSRGMDRICTSIIVAGELWHGAQKSGSDRLRKEVEQTLSRLTVFDLNRPVELKYAAIRTTLHHQGKLIGANDMWIAAHAMAEGLTLVTDDEADFSRVEGLAIENWLR